MIRSVLNKLLMVVYFVLGALLLEFVTFHLLNLGSMPEYFMYNLCIILFIGLIVYCIPNFTAQYIIYTAILITQAVFIYINYSLSYIYGDLISIDMFRLIKEANRAMTSNFVYFGVIFQLAAIIIGVAIIGLILLKYCRKDKIKIRQHYSIFNVILLLTIQFFSVGYYVHTRDYISDMSNLQDAKYTESDAFLLNTNFLKTVSYKKFGTYGYMLNLFFNSVPKINKAHKLATIDYFNSGKTYSGNQQLSTFGVDKGNNLIVIMMESLEWFGFGDGTYDYELQNLSSEFTPNIYSIIYGEEAVENGDVDKSNNAMILKNFFAKSKTNISEGYGILGNYPVGESLTSFAGKNYDSKSNAFGYSLPNMINRQNLADGVDYTTSYVHSNVISYYSRNLTHGNLGFENVIGKDKIKVDGKNPYSKDDFLWGNWDAEGDFARYAIDYIVPTNYDEQPFFTFYLNVSSHGAYTKDKNENDGDALRYYDYVKYGKDNCIIVNSRGERFYLEDGTTPIEDVNTLFQHYPNAEYVWRLDEDKQSSKPESEKYSNWYQNVLNEFGDNKDEDLCEKLVYYECGVIGLDDAIGVILNRLKEYNILDKTTMVLYSDHYAYYDGVSNAVKGFDRADTASIELNTIPAIISSPGLKQLTSSPEFKQNNPGYDFTINDRFTSAYDLIPTILELFGVPFNENFYVGTSIFKPADYAYVIDEQTHLARAPKEGELAKDMLVYYSNTGGFFSQDIYTRYLVDFYTPTGDNCNDEYLQTIFKAEATKVLIKLNYLHILNRYHLYNQITNV